MTELHATIGSFGPDQAKNRSKINPGYIYMDLLTGDICRFGKTVYMPKIAKIKRRLLLLLLTRYRADYETITNALWGEDSDGGPEYARNALFVHIWRMNTALKFIKLRIVSDHGIGLELVEL